MKTEKVKSAFTLRTNEIAEELHGACVENKNKAYILLAIDAESEESPCITASYAGNMHYHEAMLRQLVNNDEDFMSTIIKILAKWGRSWNEK